MGANANLPLGKKHHGVRFARGSKGREELVETGGTKGGDSVP